MRLMYFHNIDECKWCDIRDSASFLHVSIPSISELVPLTASKIELRILFVTCSFFHINSTLSLLIKISGLITTTRFQYLRSRWVSSCIHIRDQQNLPWMSFDLQFPCWLQWQAGQPLAFLTSWVVNHKAHAAHLVLSIFLGYQEGYPKGEGISGICGRAPNNIFPFVYGESGRFPNFASVNVANSFDSPAVSRKRRVFIHGFLWDVNTMWIYFLGGEYTDPNNLIVPVTRLFCNGAWSPRSPNRKFASRLAASIG